LHQNTPVPYLLNQRTWFHPGSNSSKQVDGFFLWKRFEHVQQRFKVLVSSLHHGGFCFCVLTLTISGDTLVTFWTIPVTLVSVRLGCGGAARWQRDTLVLRLRQAAQAREMRCLLGGTGTVSVRPAVDGRMGRNGGRGASCGLSEVGSMLTLSLPRRDSYGQSRKLVSIASGASFPNSQKKYVPFAKCNSICRSSRLGVARGSNSEQDKPPRRRATEEPILVDSQWGLLSR
jgi:hypothetical protein